MVVKEEVELIGDCKMLSSHGNRAATLMSLVALELRRLQVTFTCPNWIGIKHSKLVLGKH